jgi:methyl-accepting chemotaxis protein
MFDRHALRSTMPTAPVGLALLAVVFVIVAESRSGSTWRSTAALLVLALMVALSLPAIRRSFALRAAKHADRLRLLASLDELAAADLVRAKAIAADLPATLAVPLGEALAPLEVLATRIQSSSVEVAGAAGAVKRIASELAAGSSQQSASVVEITAAMEELAQTATQIAGNAEAQAELARLGEATGNEGSAAVARAVAGVERLRERIAAIAQRSGDLERRAERDLRRPRAGRGHRARDPPALAQRRHRSRRRNRATSDAASARSPRRSAASPDARATPPPRSAACSRSSRLRSPPPSRRRASAGARPSACSLRVTATASAIAGLRDALVETAGAAREISAGTAEQRTASLQVVQTLREASAVVQQIADGLRAFSGAARDLEEAAVSVQLLAQGFRLASPSSLRHLAESWAAELAPLLASPDALERRLESLLAERPDVELDLRQRPAAAAHRDRRAARAAPRGRRHSGRHPLRARLLRPPLVPRRRRRAARNRHLRAMTSILTEREGRHGRGAVLRRRRVGGGARHRRQPRALDLGLSPWTTSCSSSCRSSSPRRASGCSISPISSPELTRGSEPLVEIQRELHTLKGAGA